MVIPDKNKRYVVLDIETTGFSAASDKITEIGAVKIENGIITEEFSQLINPGIPIPWKITQITGINSEMVAEKPSIEEVLPVFMEFCADCTVVAHNARFDMGFIKTNANKQGLDCSFEILDTLTLARRLFPYLRNHKLDTVASHLNVELLKHHRASDDARATAHIFLKCLEHL
ncbi:MAG: 3'-5' exoribonuclease [Oscillospiraceae bacterium]|jgi:DNA polymerase-3 subunit alpha (Gram-positive type)|nr:3'-5' exoribonuclease [Oscillospiraceae bacterium]